MVTRGSLRVDYGAGAVVIQTYKREQGNKRFIYFDMARYVVISKEQDLLQHIDLYCTLRFTAHCSTLSNLAVAVFRPVNKFMVGVFA